MSESTQPDPRRVLIVFNPAAGRARRKWLTRALNHLERLECTVKVVETTSPGHAETLAREASVEDFDVIAAAGGDGTINEVVNGLKGRNLALGVVPMGTANVVADEIGLPRSPEIVANTLAHGMAQPIHVGRVNDRRFIMMSGAGFDANVVNSVSLRLKAALGPLAYVWQATRQAFIERFTERQVVIDGAAHRTVAAVVCKGRRYGGPFVAAPDASLRDDVFHVVLMKGRGWFSVARYGLGLMLGRISMWSDVSIITGRDVELGGGAGDPVQADGDIVSTVPAHISIDPEPVRLIYPVR